MTSVQKIDIDLNVNVNPRIITYNGDYCPQNHRITLICEHPSLLYARYGWHSGTVWIGNNQLESIAAKDMTDCLKNMNTTVNTCIEGPLNSLGHQLHQRLSSICQTLQNHFPEKTFQIQKYSIQVPEIVTSFKESIASSKT
jgi:hypothetical protein